MLFSGRSLQEQFGQTCKRSKLIGVLLASNGDQCTASCTNVSEQGLKVLHLLWILSHLLRDPIRNRMQEHAAKSSASPQFDQLTWPGGLRFQPFLPHSQQAHENSPYRLVIFLLPHMF